MNDILELRRMWSTERVLSPEFCLAYFHWIDGVDPDYALTYSEAFDLFAMYCMAAV